MAQKTILSSDSGSQAAGKINDNFTELYGGGGAAPSGILALNPDAVARVYATKKYTHETGDGGGVWDRQNNDGLFCIAHGSDFHTDDRTLNHFLDFVAGVPAINASIITGDFVCVQSDTFAAEAAVVKGVLDAHTVKPMLVVGNHERWSGLSMSSIASAIGFGNVVATGGTPSSGYYYKDYTTKNTQTNAEMQKIRVIVLNQYDHPSSDTKANAAVTGTFSSSQISFFISALKGAKSAGMAVMVAMHAAERMPLNGGEDNPFFQRASSDRWSSGYTTACNGTIIEDIVDAFRKGNSINKTYTFTNGAASITVNDSFSGNGHFIAYMVGHSHVDSIGYSTEHPDQLYLMCPASCCVPNAAAQQTYNYGTESSDLPRVQNTKTEDCFNVYGIDTVHKRVKVVRVGADTNDLMEPREMACYDYEPTNS